MSCSTLNQQTVRFTVSGGSLPENFCPDNLQALFNAFVNRLIISTNVNFTSFAIGSTAPTTNVGPWLKDCETWFVWDDNVAMYVPMVFPSIASVPPGTVHAWAGTISNIPPGYLLADGRELNRSDYPALFAAIGTCYGSVDPCDCKFNLPDLRNKFIVGAQEDSGGCAMTNVSDGATLTKCRDYTAHTHTGQICTHEQDNTDGADPSSADNDCYPFTTSAETPRAIPPYCAMVWIIKY